MVDQPGLGRSDMPPQPYAYSIENQADAVLRLTDALGLARFNLMGHSMGGGIVLYIALNEPERVNTAVVIDPACFRPPWRLRITSPLVKYLAPLLAGRWSVKLALKDVYYDDDKVDDTLVEEYYQPMQREGYWRVLAALQKEYFSPAFDRMTSRYGEFRVPLLIVWGEQDTWLPVGYGRELKALIPDAQFTVLAGCGHNTHQECGEALNRVVAAFYGKQLGHDTLHRARGRAAGTPWTNE
jgi:pimeloyl-ACP methyl ester carboxylesterase